MVKPGDARVNLFLLQLLGQVLVVGAKLISMGGVVEGHDDGVLLDANIAIEAMKDGPSQVRGVPAGVRFSQPLTQLMEHGLGDEGHRHLTVTDIEVAGASPFPSPGLDEH